MIVLAVVVLSFLAGILLVAGAVALSGAVLHWLDGG